MTDAPAVPPALSPEEWRDGHLDVPGFMRFGTHAALYDWGVYVTAQDDDGSRIEEADRHALAALCLYGQPYGFTHEDVEDLRSGAAQLRAARKDVVQACPEDYNVDVRLARLASRIAALLPPEPETP